MFQRGAGSGIEDKLSNCDSSLLSPSRNLNDNKTGVAFDVRRMVITIIILSPEFCSGFVSEVQFHILSAIKSWFFWLLIAMPF